MARRLPDTQRMALAIAENSVHGIVVMDESGYGLYANRAWQEITGYSIEEMQSKPVHDCVHHHHPDGRPFPIDECPIGCTLGKNQTVRNHRDLFFRKDGSPFYVSCAASPISGDGAPVLMILEIRNISEEVEADKRKEDFLAMLAHELRNPLAPIAAAADLLRLGNYDEQRVRQTSAVITRQVGHMVGMVEDLLDVSRVTRGLVELDKKVLDTKTILLEAVEQVRPLIEERRHQLKFHVLPEPAMVRGDRKRLVQVFANLLNNAAKYTPEGGEITVNVNVKGDAVGVSVADNGIGMTPEMTVRAFDLFSQAQRSSDRTQGGLGIGLALVKNLVAMHGGHVTAHSEGLDKGSIVTVRLPHYDQNIVQPIDDEANEALTVASEPLKVMVVDDNADAAHMLAMLVEAMGHEVYAELNSHKAIESALHKMPDVFLLDIGLPDIDGKEMARQIRRQPQNASALLVAVTGYGQDHDRQAAFDAGFDQHIVKPVDIKQLTKILSEAQKVCR